MRFLSGALLFAFAASVPLLVADAIWGIGFTPLDLRHRIAGLHGLFHVGTVTLSVLGAWIGLRSNGDPAPSRLLLVAFGALFGGVSIVAAPAALVFADTGGVAFWQFIGAMFGAAMAGWAGAAMSSRGRTSR